MNAEADRVAWEDGSLPFPANLGFTWWDCLVSPAAFFRRVSWEGPLARPVLYFLVVVVLAATLGLFWFLWGPWGGTDAYGLTLELQLLSFFLTPFVLLLVLGLMALVQHLFVVFLAPARRGLGATTTVLCYASGVGVVSALFPPALGLLGRSPGFGGMLYMAFNFVLAAAVQVWYVVVVVIGLREAHATTTGRAVAIVLLPIGIGLVLTTGLVIAAIMLFALADLPL